MSRHRNDFTISQTDDELWESTTADEQLQVDLRLDLDRAAASDEEMLRSTPPKRPSRQQLQSLAFQIYKARRDRARTFGGNLFGEPAWDMLLALYCLPVRGEVLTVSSLSLASETAGTTGIRWQRVMCDLGLIQRGPHILDRRQRLVGLTHRGRLLMEEYLTRLHLCRGGLPDTDHLP